MDITLFPTKGNLIAAKNTLRLARQGYDLLDKKRNILIREMMEQIERAKDLQSRINETFEKAYRALQVANIALGVSNVEQIAQSVPAEDGYSVKFKSIMGVLIPVVDYAQRPLQNSYGILSSESALDEAYAQFDRVRRLTLELAEVENTVYRLAYGIRRTQKRANALKNIMIPRYETLSKSISESLEEKEREEFTRLKVIKSIKAAAPEV